MKKPLSCLLAALLLFSAFSVAVSAEGTCGCGHAPIVFIDGFNARDLVLEPHIQLSVDPNRPGVEAMWRHMKQIGYAEGEIDLGRAIDTSLYRDALEQLRREQPDPFWEQLERRFREQNP